MRFLSRALSAVVLGVMLMVPVEAQFVDVPTDDVGSEAITALSEEGIVDGYEDGTYRPNQLITREEFTKLIIATQFAGDEIEKCLEEHVSDEWEYVFFLDVSRDVWSAPYICIAKVYDIVSGYPGAEFRREKTIIFAEAAKILAQSFGFTAEADPEVWYRPFVQYLAEKNAIPLSVTHFDQPMTRRHMAQMLYRLLDENAQKTSRTYTELEVGGECGSISFLEDIPVLRSRNEILWQIQTDSPEVLTVLWDAEISDFVCIAVENEADRDMELNVLRVFSAESVVEIDSTSIVGSIEDAEVSENDIGLCVQDSDCVVVSYEHCCGATKRALNQQYSDLYAQTPEWQSFVDAETCAQMGECRDDANVSEARCVAPDDGGASRCELVFESSETEDSSPDEVVEGDQSSMVIREFSMTAKSWEFVPSSITVQKGDFVRLSIMSIDVLHGFALPDFDINENLEPGKMVVVEFVADTAGTFPFFCSVFCGAGHSNMTGILIVEE